MRILAIIITILLSFSTASAGLFEYHLTGQGVSNATSSERADAVESIHPNSVKNKDSFISNSKQYYNYSDTRYDWTYGNVRQSREYYHSTNPNSYNFYRKNDLIELLEAEVDDIKREERDIKREIEDTEDELRDLRNVSSRYYTNMREDLEHELEYLEDVEDELQDIRKEIQNEIRDIKRDNTSRFDTSYYYNYYGSNNYNRSNYYSRGYNYHRYNYDRTPSWVNPELEDVKEGRVWIR